ncbi:MAG: sodium:phosphate symporter [Deltaproteobacteria bacterium]|nr:MAG: sodium:phosphate symporter [Deltaproteobacteria bacterium]
MRVFSRITEKKNVKRMSWLLPVALGVPLWHLPVLAADSTGSGDISWVMIAIGLLGGLAFFLFGMEMMSEGLKASAGSRMRSILGTLTRNPYMGYLVGAFITMVIQSSSATTVMLVSFVQSELMAFSQTLGVILGAGLGTTITAQLIAFKLSDYALVMVAAGVLFRMVGKKDGMKNLGDVIFGFGVLFYGMKLMSGAMAPLRTHDAFIGWMQGLENPALGLLAGTAMTALIQSSSAFTGIVIVMGQQGLVSLDGSIPLILGANIGTCVTAGFASIGASRDAKRVALAHFIFRVFGVLVFILWIPAFAECIRWIAGFFGSGIGRQIANAHTIFNVGLGVVFLPFTPVFGAFIMKLLPERSLPEDSYEPNISFLDENSIIYPSLALDLVRSEVARMAGKLEKMLRAIAIPFSIDEERMDREYTELTLIEAVDLREREIDFLEYKISDYLYRLAREGVSEKEACMVYAMMSIVKDMESIGDIIVRNIKPLIPKKQALDSDFSPEGREELEIYHQKACKQIRLLKEAFLERDVEKARYIMEKEKKYLDLESQYRIRHLDRMIHARQESVDTHEVHMELMNFMTQIIVYCANIAKNYLNACPLRRDYA